MYFKLEHIVRKLSINIEESDSREFAYGGPHQVTVSLRKASTKDAHTSDLGRDYAVCTAMSQQEPSPEIRAMFASLAESRLPQGSDLEKASNMWADHAFEPDGRIKESHGVPFEILPQSFRSFVEQAKGELYDFLTRTVQVLRWRGAAKGPHSPFSVSGWGWSFDGQLWKPVPSVIQVFWEAISPLRATGEVCVQVERLVTEGATEPIGHELYREAWEQRHQNPRSSLVIGMAAAEVGFKQCVSTLVPDAKWLVEEAPSPPLVRMLQEYLPQLPAKCMIQGEVLQPPDEVMDALKKGQNLRNKVAHVGIPAPAYGTLEKVLLAVHDLLWILDYYCGHDWALEQIRPEIKRAFIDKGAGA
ncbi:hypothetical protein MYX64_06070 [Nitrospinae bacterium AH_259_B05_G02_I21]|nr:hypothetical protein [Nitrospinae bacterium AH_259_B05_G02_I21]MDA2931782.1 hypothetical protein [Nitrospinae bacterium AH-259-F20]